MILLGRDEIPRTRIHIGQDWQLWVRHGDDSYTTFPQDWLCYFSSSSSSSARMEDGGWTTSARLVSFFPLEVVDSHIAAHRKVEIVGMLALRGDLLPCPLLHR